MEVPYPPPPARVELVPPRKDPNEVWVDGQWDWDGKEWKWNAGQWMTPLPNAYFTPWKVVRRDDGKLFFARAAWRDPNGRAIDSRAGEVCTPPPAATRAGEVAKK